jgi:hypothetical protein
VDGFAVERGDSTSQLADKGTAFHEAAEQAMPGDSVEKLENLMNENAAKLGVPAGVYDYHEAAVRLKGFMDLWIAPLIEKGYKPEHEQWVKGTLCGEPFVGALDMKLTGGEGDLHYIVDFKTGKTARTDSYHKQLLLYAYFLGLESGWNYEQIADKTRLYIFFPLADLGKTKAKLPDDERALESLKEVKFTADDLRGAIARATQSVEDAVNFDWAKASNERDACITFACAWCPYQGIPKDLNESCHCEKSRKAGKTCPRGIKITENKK